MSLLAMMLRALSLSWPALLAFAAVSSSLLTAFLVSTISCTRPFTLPSKEIIPDSSSFDMLISICVLDSDATYAKRRRKRTGQQPFGGEIVAAVDRQARTTAVANLDALDRVG